jgi:hypothetical protein
MAFERVSAPRLDGTPGLSVSNDPFRGSPSSFVDSVPQSGPMDEAETRGRASGRRMASTRGSVSKSRSRTAGSSRDSKKPGAEPPVSSVRWAGVGLVMAALLGAITLAVISPSDPSGVQAGTVTQPTPTPTVKPEARVPVTEVRIISPDDEITTIERQYEITVTVPQYELPQNALMLQVYRNGKAVRNGLEQRPAADDIVIGPISLAPGRNEITAALTTSGGAGPVSEPVVINVDKAGPDISVNAPKESVRLFKRNISVTGKTEVGALVTVLNRANKIEQSETVGPGGAFEISIALDEGDNKLVIKAADAAGNKSQPIRRIVTRVDPVPRVNLTIRPKELRLDALPVKLRMTARATDSTGSPLKDVEAVFTLAVPDKLTETKTVTTNADGQANWNFDITPGGAKRGEALVGVEVRANGEIDTDSKKLILK